MKVPAAAWSFCGRTRVRGLAGPAHLANVLLKHGRPAYSHAMASALIIESDTAFAQQLQSAFGARGVDVTLTADGNEGLSKAHELKPDVIVLCVELSGVSGYSICNKLKKDPELAAIPLVLTSSQATEETFEQHKKLKNRADAYLRKPYET